MASIITGDGHQWLAPVPASRMDITFTAGMVNDPNAMGMPVAPGPGTIGKGMSGGEFNNFLETAGTNLYIKGLPAGITEDQVKAIFNPYGTVV